MVVFFGTSLFSIILHSSLFLLLIEWPINWFESLQNRIKSLDSNVLTCTCIYDWNLTSRPQHNFRDIAIEICSYLRRLVQAYTADISWDCTGFTASTGEKIVAYGNGKSSDVWTDAWFCINLSWAGVWFEWRVFIVSSVRGTFWQ